MVFDPNTAHPVSPAFDPSTAEPVAVPAAPKPQFAPTTAVTPAEHFQRVSAHLVGRG
jgi:hypothetical protein